jgi:hypothetical protein
MAQDKPAPPSSLTIATRIVTSSIAGSAVLVELTVPQVVRLSQPTVTPLPATPFASRLAMQPRLLPMQTALTSAQLGLTRILRDELDRAFGPSPLHMAGAYGVVSGPSRAAAYNLVISGTCLAVRPCLGARREEPAARGGA